MEYKQKKLNCFLGEIRKVTEKEEKKGMEMTLNFQSVARCTVVRVFSYWAVETIVMGSVCRRVATEVVRCHTTKGRWKGLPT